MPYDYKEILRKIPGLDSLLQAEALKPLIKERGEAAVSKKVRKLLENFRSEVLADKSKTYESAPDFISLLQKEFSEQDQLLIGKVINTTGIMLHTNLGRAPLPPAVSAEALNILSGYCDLEFDRKTGRRGSRNTGLESLICELLNCEAALAVNNNAACVMLALAAIRERAIAQTRKKLEEAAAVNIMRDFADPVDEQLKRYADKFEIIVARSELVEIGGSFRVPEIIARSGMVLKEIGTGNKTHLSDYENAIGSRTCAILKVHRSNFKISGFTEEVDLKELRVLCDEHDLPLVYDLGSGLFAEDVFEALYDEPTVREALAADVDILCFSGDKLFGGPQAGIACGRKELIDLMKKNQLMRALRPGKLTLTVLQRVLKLYSENKEDRLPLIMMGKKTAEELIAEVAEFIKRIEADGEFKANLEEAGIEIRADYSEAEVGGGSAPDRYIKSAALYMRFAETSIQAGKLEGLLRQPDDPKKTLPVIARINEGELIFDFRTLLEADKEPFYTSLKTAVAELRN